MLKSYKFRLYPNKHQRDLLTDTFGCVRLVYNLMLSDKIKAYQETGENKTFTPAMYKTDYPFLKNVDSLALANAQMHLQTAYNNFFRNKKFGFPKFKSKKHSKRAYTTNNVNNNIVVLDNAVKLPKLGVVKAKIHRQPDTDWKLKSATITQDKTNDYYVSILFDITTASNVYAIDINNAIGLDYTSNGLYVDDKGNIGTNHRFYRESHKKLAKAQRKLSRKIGSGKNEPKSADYLKQLQKVNRIYKKISNQRLDNLHKISTEIANQYDVVCVESLNMKSIANRHFHNGKSTYDNGFGMFITMLDYKLAERNKCLIKVDKWFPSSQLCSQCGKRHPEMKDLHIRTLVCDCGLTISRDVNAAINIKAEGLKLLNNII